MAAISCLLFVLVALPKDLFGCVQPECVQSEPDSEVCLMQTIIGVTSKDQGNSFRRNGRAHFPNSAGWFGGFSEEESTYTAAGVNVNAAIKDVGGWSPTLELQADRAKQAKDSQWFQESASGGYKQAWQTFFPALRTSVSKEEAQTGDWLTGGDRLQETYHSFSPGVGEPGPARPAAWFDNDVNQVDGFGREMYPSLGSPRNYLYWEERSVNTSLTCKDPGCTANVSLLAPFDWNKEIAKDCKLTVFFHPTDFDDQYSGERVEWVQVNSKEVVSNCHPQSHGCNQTADRPLIPCVSELPIDALMPKNGHLKIAAKIPKVVDECPYKGNHLSAVPVVTCLVTPIVVHKPTPPPAQTLFLAPCRVKMPLQCPTRGCAAEIEFPLRPHCYHMNKCTLAITVNQTDYDEKDGTSELIEYIKVNGEEVAKQVKPGKNPCKAAFAGKPLKTSDLSFSAVKDHELKNLSGTHIRIEGKISQYVDECASDGYLFNAMAEVTCSPKSKPSKR